MAKSGIAMMLAGTFLFSTPAVFAEEVKVEIKDQKKMVKKVLINNKKTH